MEKSSAVIIIVNFNIPYKKTTVNNDKSQTKKSAESTVTSNPV